MRAKKLVYVLTILFVPLTATAQTAPVGDTGIRAPQLDSAVMPFEWTDEPGHTGRIFCGWYCKPGMFVTCKHNVDWPVGTRLNRPDGRTAQLLAVAAEWDGYAVWKIDPPDDTAVVLPLSDKPLKRGDRVIHAGMPQGRPAHVTIGKVVGMGDTLESDSGAPMPCDWSSATYDRGYSGGPVLNESHKVVGINTASQNDRGGSTIVPVSYLVKLLEQAAATTDTLNTDASKAVERPYAEVFTAADFPCPACVSWETHARSTRSKRSFDYRVYKLPSAELRSIGVDSVPVFRVNGKWYSGSISHWSDIDRWAAKELALVASSRKEVSKSEPAVGWGGSTPDDIQRLKDAPDDTELAMGWPPHPHQYRRNPPRPRQEDPPPQPQVPPGVTASPEALAILAQAMDPPKKQKEPDPTVDWDGVTLVVAASNAVPRAATIAEGPGKRALQRLTDGKAVLRIVSERTNPEQFAAYEQRIGVPVDLFHVTVLIAKRDVPLPVDFAIRQVEIRLNAAAADLLGERIKDIPVEPILERIQSDEYVAMLDLSFEADVTRPEQPDGVIGILMSLLGLIAGPFALRGIESRLEGWKLRKIHKKVTEGGAA